LIRAYQPRDWEAIRRMHAESGLPDVCLPDMVSRLMVVKIVAEENGKVVQFGGVRLTGECFSLLDHAWATPETRWDAMQLLIAHGLSKAADYGLDQVSAWLPPGVQESFGPRLEAMGWIKSPWPNWTAILK
jgi:hypothetical protein